MLKHIHPSGWTNVLLSTYLFVCLSLLVTHRLSFGYQQDPTETYLTLSLAFVATTHILLQMYFNRKSFKKRRPTIKWRLMTYFAAIALFFTFKLSLGRADNKPWDTELRQVGN